MLNTTVKSCEEIERSAAVNTVMNLPVAKNGGNFFSA
jgi:hypothetical protein